MTESIFIALHANQGVNVLNIPGRLHLNVNPVDINNSNEGIITSVIVHVVAESIDGSTNNSSGQLNIESVLEQVETIEFNFNENHYTLDIISTTFYPTGNPFFYFTIDPVYIEDIYDAAAYEASIENVTFTPYLADLDFGFSDSNPLFSNASEQRESIRIMESNRSDSTVVPSNIDALLDEKADKATIQDSLYYDTGWSNSRYKGSKTSPTDNAGIDPALSGRSFKGEGFSIETTTDYICQSDNRLQQDFFHDGNTQLPRFTLGDTADENGILTGIASVTLQQLAGGTEGNPQADTTINHTEVEEGAILPGDLLTLNPDGTITPVEHMLVVSTGPTLTTVIRDIFNARVPLVLGGTFPNYQPGTKIHKISKYNIFNIEQSGQARLNSVGTQRIYIEGNNSIINTNKEGVLVSQSFCPVFINYVDSPNG